MNMGFFSIPLQLKARWSVAELIAVIIIARAGNAAGIRPLPTGGATILFAIVIKTPVTFFRNFRVSIARLAGKGAPFPAVPDGNVPHDGVGYVSILVDLGAGPCSVRTVCIGGSADKQKER